MEEKSQDVGDGVKERGISDKMREALPCHGVVKAHIFNDQVGFPPIFADMPLLRIV